MTHTQWTVNAIQDAVRATGSHWFDPGTMRTFGTTVLPPVYQGDGGVYFVTHDDRFDHSTGYTVRQFTPDDSGIETVGELAKYNSEEQAKFAARTAAGANLSATAPEPFKPVSDLEQFVFDCRKHGNSQASMDTARKLLSNAGYHHRYMEDQCNGEGPYRGWNSDDGDPESVERCRNRIRELSALLGAKGVVFSGDPRGCTVKLQWADGATNDFVSEGWCVPGA